MRYKGILIWISIVELIIIILIRALCWYLDFNSNNSYALIEDTQWMFDRIVVDGDSAGKVCFNGCMPVFVADDDSFVFITEHDDFYEGTIQLYNSEKYTYAYMLTPNGEDHGFFARIVPTSSDVFHPHPDSLSIMLYYKPKGMAPMKIEYIFVPADSPAFI